MKFFKIILAAMAIAFLGCSIEETTIVCGRDWNNSAEVVADTSSEFLPGDPLIVQFRYGKNFDFDKLKIAFYDGSLTQKGNEIWNREIPVSKKTAVYTLQGKSKHGGLMTARELLRHKKVKTAVIEFSANGKVLASKEILIKW